MQQTQTTLGGLTCRVIDDLSDGQQPRLIAVLCHGFGAPGTDLVSLGPELMRERPELASCVRFIFPEAPLSLDAIGMFGGRAWWHLDVAKLNAAIESDDFRNQRNDLPEGLTEATAMLSSLIDEVCEQTGLPMSRIVLGGFSQGSMLATDVALRLAEPPAGLCIWSGTLLCEAEWRERAKNQQPFPVLQSHGRQDPLLPFAAAEWLRDLLSENGMPVEFLPFDGPHTISYESMKQYAELLVRVCG